MEPKTQKWMWSSKKEWNLGLGHVRDCNKHVSTALQQGARNFNVPPRLIGRDLRSASSSAKLRILLHPLQLPHSPEASNLGSRANEAIAH